MYHILHITDASIHETKISKQYQYSFKLNPTIKPSIKSIYAKKYANKHSTFHTSIIILLLGPLAMIRHSTRAVGSFEAARLQKVPHRLSFILSFRSLTTTTFCGNLSRRIVSKYAKHAVDTGADTPPITANAATRLHDVCFFCRISFTPSLCSRFASPFSRLSFSLHPTLSPFLQNKQTRSERRRSRRHTSDLLQLHRPAEVLRGASQQRERLRCQHQLTAHEGVSQILDELHVVQLLPIEFGTVPQRGR